MNGEFKTLYFSDTFVFYQNTSGFYKKAFLDVYAIGKMLLSALLSRGIPARGAIAFGEFDVRKDSSGAHDLYYGKAFLEAYRAEQKENWIGISILPSAWMPYESAEGKGVIEAFEHSRVWRIRSDKTLMLNPFGSLEYARESGSLDQEGRYFEDWDAPTFPNEIRALRFVCEKAELYAKGGDFSGREAVKYHATVSFLENILGDDMFSWARRIGLTKSKPNKDDSED